MRVKIVTTYIYNDSMYASGLWKSLISWSHRWVGSTSISSSAPLAEVGRLNGVQYLLEEGAAYLYYPTFIINLYERGIMYLIIRWRIVEWKRGFSDDPSGYKNFYTVWIVFFERYVLDIETFDYSVLSICTVFKYLCLWFLFILYGSTVSRHVFVFLCSLLRLVFSLKLWITNWCYGFHVVIMMVTRPLIWPIELVSQRWSFSWRYGFFIR